MLSVLKFALPCTPDFAIPSLPQGVTSWAVPHILKKVSDVDKADFLLAPLANAKVCKQPEKKDVKPKPKAKPKGKKNKRALDDDDDEQITASIYGEDLLNAVNYTLEKVQPHHRKPASVAYALDLGVLFALESNLDFAGITPKLTVWTKTRKFIKCYLNRSHALRARGSDPDVAIDLMSTLGDQQHDDEEREDKEDDDEVDCYQRLSALLRISNIMNVTSYLDNNFTDFSSLDLTSSLVNQN